MAEDLIPILTRFHREVIAPDIKRIVGEAVDALEQRMNGHFDAIYQRFDRLEAEYQMLARQRPLQDWERPWEIEP